MQQWAEIRKRRLDWPGAVDYRMNSLMLVPR